MFSDTLTLTSGPLVFVAPSTTMIGYAFCTERTIGLSFQTLSYSSMVAGSKSPVFVYLQQLRNVRYVMSVMGIFSENKKNKYYLWVCYN